jgi:hypothetical protein
MLKLEPRLRATTTALSFFVCAVLLVGTVAVLVGAATARLP